MDIKSFRKKLNFGARVVRKILHVPEPIPQYVQLALTNICNLNCDMCMRFYLDIDVEERHMQWDDFRKIVDKLNGVKQIALSGLGESMNHPRLFDAIKYCKNKGLVAQLTSNGTLLGKNNNVTRIIESGIDTMSFSIEGISNRYDRGHNNIKVLKDIQDLIHTRNSLNAKHPEVVIQTILFSGREKEVYDTIKWSAENGVTRVNVIRVDKRFVPDLERPSVEQEKKVARVFDTLRKNYNFRIDFFQDQVFSGIAAVIYKHFKSLLRFDDWCTRFNDFIYINVNGNVYPCCISKPMLVGNLLEDDLDTIWLGSKFQYIRKNQDKFSFCDKCDFLRLKQLA